jgi:hypothetical protein
MTEVTRSGSVTDHRGLLRPLDQSAASRHSANASLTVQLASEKLRRRAHRHAASLQTDHMKGRSSPQFSATSPRPKNALTTTEAVANRICHYPHRVSVCGKNDPVTKNLRSPFPAGSPELLLRHPRFHEDQLSLPSSTSDRMNPLLRCSLPELELFGLTLRSSRSVSTPKGLLLTRRPRGSTRWTSSSASPSDLDPETLLFERRFSEKPGGPSSFEHPPLGGEPKLASFQVPLSGIQTNRSSPVKSHKSMTASVSPSVSWSWRLRFRSKVRKPTTPRVLSTHTRRCQYPELSRLWPPRPDRRTFLLPLPSTWQGRDKWQ